MCAAANGKNFVDVMGYTVPRYHDCKKPYVDFYCMDPGTGKVRRKKYYVDSIRSKRERRRAADDLIYRLTSKLSSGWCPWSTEVSRSMTLIDDVLDQYLTTIEKSLRHTSVHSYTSRVNVFRQYLSSLPHPPSYVYQIDRVVAVGFLDWLLGERGVGARTRNNYRDWLYGFCDYLAERKHIECNPVAGLRKLIEPKKSRVSLNAGELRQLVTHLNVRDRPFLLACMMEYYTFIRPAELRHVRLRDISVRDMTVFVPSEHSKNKRDGKVSLNDEIIKLMLDLGVLAHDADCYLFGPGFVPGSEQIARDAFNKRWAQVRGELQWPDNLKFYSLKDSGIRDLSNSAGVVTARDQARHNDVSTTNRYLQGRDVSAPENARHFSGPLSISGETHLSGEGSGPGR